MKRATPLTASPTIAHVAGYYPPHLGGMEKVAEALAEGLAARGHDTRVITSCISQPQPAPAPRNNLRITRLWAFEFAHTPWAPGLPKALFTLPKHTILHLHLAQAMYPEWVWLVAKLRQQPYVVHFHLDLQPSGPLGKLFLVYKATLLRGTIRHANKVIVFSKDQQAFIHAKYGVRLRDIAVIPNGVAEEFFQSARECTHKDTYKLLYVGRLSPQKRVDRLLDAMALLKTKAELTIIGDGEDREDLVRQAERLRLTNVTFVGFKNAVEIRAYHARSDVFVTTSDREGMPLVVLEAMAAGIAVVGTDVPGTHELLDGVGVLCGVSPEAIAAALDKTLNPAMLTKLSKRSIAASRNHSWPKIITMFEKLYSEVDA